MDLKDSQSATMTSSPRLYFHGPALHQYWSLPESYIYYITKNPSSPRAYRILTRSCKHFYLRNPIVCLSCLHYTKDGCKICKKSGCKFDTGECYNFDLDAISCKLWVLGRLDLCDSNEATTSMLISKLHRCDAIICNLHRQSITFDQFKLMCSSAVECELRNVSVSDYNGKEVMLDELVAELPRLKIIKVEFAFVASNLSSDTVKRLIQLENFSNIDVLCFYNIPDTFDIKSFSEYIKTTKAHLTGLYFRDSLSDAYKKELDGIVDKILSPSAPFSRVPFLMIPGLETSKSNALFERFSAQF